MTNARWLVAILLIPGCGQGLLEDGAVGDQDSSAEELTAQTVTVQAESMELSRYAVEDGERIKLTASTGTATKTVNGGGRHYRLKIHVVTEATGAPRLEVFGGSNLLGTFDYPKETGTKVFIVEDAQIGSSMKLKLVGYRQSGALARVDKIVFESLQGTSLDMAAPADLSAPAAPDMARPSSSCTGGNATLTNHIDFESYPFDGASEKLYPGGMIALDTQRARAGSGSGRFTVGTPTLTPAECTLSRYRSEIRMQPGQVFPWDDGKPYWIGVSFNPVTMGEAHTLLQIHASNEDAASLCNYAGNAITIVPAVRNGVPYYDIVGIITDKPAGDGATNGSTLLWSEPMALSKWTDFVFNFTLSTKGAGYFRVWRNGQLVIEKTGITNVHHVDSCNKEIPADKRQHNGPHIGIYGPSCQDSSPPPHFRELFVDEVRTAIGTDGFSIVNPGC